MTDHDWEPSDVSSDRLETQDLAAEMPEHLAELPPVRRPPILPTRLRRAKMLLLVSRPMALAPRTRIGPYEILTLLGSGGMGEVYRATDTNLKRDVAIKVLPDGLARDPERLTRFRREAELLAALNHPNVAAVYGLERSGSAPAIVMELIEGPTLSEVIAGAAGPSRRPTHASRSVGANDSSVDASAAGASSSQSRGLPIGDALRIARQIADALDAAHQLGIVHRDLKPGNVKVRPDGCVKVLDFGLAKAMDVSNASAIGADSDSLADTYAATQVGAIVGTAPYMSPEQAQGKPVDARSDIFSFGVVLYELVGGRRPFDGSSMAEILSAVLRDDPPPVQAPAGVGELVSRCLAKRPADRFASMADVRDALGRVLRADASTDEKRPSVAVLPFANMTADPDNEFFCDGIAEEITGALGKVDRLRVAGRTSAFAFKGRAADLREIGRMLDVDAVLEGSVRRAGHRLRVSAQLVKAIDGYQLWSERYDRQMADVFDVQDEIALAVVDALKVTLLGDERAAVVRRATDNAEAYQLCLKAYHAWARWNDEGFRTAQRLFGEALALDPNYAIAHFGLGDCHASWVMLGREPMTPHITEALRELRSAVALDPQLADAHAVLGLVESMYEWQWATAADRFRTALALDPRSAHIRNVYGLFLGMTGRYQEAVEALRLAINLDPLGPLWNACYAQMLLGAGDYDGALRQARATLDLVPHHWFALEIAGQAQVELGAFDDAIASFAHAVDVSGEAPYVIGLLGNALARAGREHEALEQLALLERRASAQFVPSLARAFVHAGLGQSDRAFVLIEAAADERCAWLAQSLTVNATLNPLRSDARFEALRRQLNLPPG